MLCAFLFLYAIYLIYGANFSVVKTETASLTTVADSINTSGYIVRNETLIKNNVSGVVAYEYDGNRKVAAGGLIAKVYASEQDASNHKLMNQLQEQISIFEKLGRSAKRDTAGLDSVRNRINANIININKSVVSGDLLDLGHDEDNLIYALNESKLIVGEVKDYSAKIEQLQKEYNRLKGITGEAIAEIRSPVSGYFTTSTDGYEKKFSYKSAEDTSVEQMNSNMKKKPDKVDGNVIGKVISDLNWYLVCPIEAKESLAINRNLDSSDIKVNMPYAAAQSLPVQIAAMNQKSKTDKGALVLQCNYMSPVLSSLRREELRLDIQSYEGLKISKSALHQDYVTKIVTDSGGKEREEKKRVQGVYVVSGNILEFKEVVIAYSGEDYIICKQSPDADELFNGTTVELYDRVVTEGTDLYDGKSVRA